MVVWIGKVTAAHVLRILDKKTYAGFDFTIKPLPAAPSGPVLL